MAGCLILEDLGKHFDLLSNSESLLRLSEKPIVQKWKQSIPYRSFEGLANFLPIYFGVTNDELIHGILGESVVLALQIHEGTPPVGVFACRASKEEMLAKVIDRLTTANAHRKVIPHDYRGMTFHERHEFNGRQDFVLQLGSVAVLTDKQQMIEQIINASLDKKSLDQSPLFSKCAHRSARGPWLNF